MNVAIRFPQGDIDRMDRLINQGDYISRSDLIREGARRVIEQQDLINAEKEGYVLAMKKERVFEDKKLIALVQLFIGKKISKYGTVIKQLLKDPLKPIKISKGQIILTDIGRDLAKGFIKAEIIAKFNKTKRPRRDQ